MSTQFAVDLVFKSQTQQLDKVANQIKSFERDISKLQGKNPFEGAERGARGAGREVDGLTKKTKGLEAAFKAVSVAASGIAVGAIVNVGSDLAKTTSQFLRLNQALTGITGSANAASAAWGSVYRVQAQTGQASDELARGMMGVLIAAKGTAFEGAKAASAFEQLTTYSFALTGSAAKAEQAMNALQQMMSKGKVGAEELRGQLGDALPGALELFRQSYKGGSVSMVEFNKLMDEGKLSINDFVGINDVLKQKMDGLYGAGFSDYMSKQAQFNQGMERLKLLVGTVAVAIANGLLPPLTTLIGGIATGNPKVLSFAAAIGAIATGAIVAAAALSTLNAAMSFLGIGAGFKKGGKALLSLASKGPAGAGLATLIAAAIGGGAVLGVKKLTEEFEGGIKDMQKLITDASKFDLSALGGNKNPLDPTVNEEAAEKLAADQAQLDKTLAQNAIRLDETVFQNRKALLEQQYEFERRLQEKNTDNWVMGFTGAARAMASLITQFGSKGLGYATEFKQLLTKRAEAEQKLKSAKAGVGVAQVGSSSPAITSGFSNEQLAAATSAASRFNGIANMCSESVKAFYKSLGISLPGVTAWADTVRNAGTVMKDWSKLRPGDIVATGRPGDTPHVGVATGGNNVFHQSGSRGLRAGNYPDLDYFKQSGYFVRPNATASAGGKDNVASAIGDVSTAQAELQGINEQIKQFESSIGRLKEADITGFALQVTDAFRTQADEIKNTTAQLELRAVLEAKGMGSGFIDAEVKKLAVTQDLTKGLETLKAGFDSGKISQEVYTATTGALTTAATNAATALTTQGTAIDRVAAASKEAAELQSLYQGISDQIANGIGGALDAVTGNVKNLGETLKGLAADIMKAVGKMLIFYGLSKAFGALSGGNDNSIFGMLSKSFGGGKATGGPVEPNTTYLVGERGPELLQMGSSGGHVFNAHQTQDAMARYSPMAGGAAAEGGGGDSAVTTYSPNITATHMGGNDWVTVDQMNKVVQQGMAAAAKQGAAGGHARVMGDFRNKRSVRSRLGV